jgi:amino acid transporter|tara:strand:- start:699 stop:1085 length:387 start_codon:yes stop_codon:yes gene_type:complete
MIGLDKEQKSFIKKVVPLVAFIGGLCCFTPVILVLFGLSSVAFAASLSNTLYGTYKWAFRGIALFLLALSLFWYFFKREKVCTFDELKKKRRKIINFTLIVLITAILSYIIWLYVIVEIIGILLGIWG